MLKTITKIYDMHLLGVNTISSHAATPDWSTTLGRQIPEDSRWRCHILHLWFVTGNFYNPNGEGMPESLHQPFCLCMFCFLAHAVSFAGIEPIFEHDCSSGLLLLLPVNHWSEGQSGISESMITNFLTTNLKTYIK